MWTHKGLQIDVNHKGRFEARISDDLKVDAPTLEECRRRIDGLPKDKRKIALAVIGERLDALCSATLTGINRTTRALQFESYGESVELDNVLADTDDNRRLLASFLAAKQSFERLADLVHARTVELSRKYGRIDAANYNEELEILEESYQNSKRLDPDVAEKA